MNGQREDPYTGKVDDDYSSGSEYEDADGFVIEVFDWLNDFDFDESWGDFDGAEDVWVFGEEEPTWPGA